VKAGISAVTSAVGCTVSQGPRVEPRIPLAQAVRVAARSGATLDPAIRRMDRRVGSWSTPHCTVRRTTWLTAPMWHARGPARHVHTHGSTALPCPSLPRHNTPAPPPLHIMLTPREVTAPCRSTTRPPLKLACLFHPFELQHCHKTPLTSCQPTHRPPHRCPTSHVHSTAAVHVSSLAAPLLRPAEPPLPQASTSSACAFLGPGYRLSPPINSGCRSSPHPAPPRSPSSLSRASHHRHQCRISLQSATAHRSPSTSCPSLR
jgi:hypothetical protein